MGFQIEGAVALVTGANRGIGEALVDALFAKGALKVYAGARQLADLAALQTRHGDKLVPLQLDVTKASDILSATGHAQDVTLLINNAGLAAHMGQDFADPTWLSAGRAEMDVNYFGTLHMMQAFSPILGRNGGGAIANVGSVASLVSFPPFMAYSASKSATHSVTQAARLVLAAQGTQVFGIYPGPVDTRMAEQVPFEKAMPTAAAQAMVEEIEAGVEEIFPDPIAKEFGRLWRGEPKSLEAHVSQMMAA
ncbi:SDR family oxidoreductase [Paucibacter sp. DJ1R-11]|uniref:SDR family oxidoreductase n=1 Tax=Paucibacter sp. DJ1R-11 TaxID=2893556 RepID=UPI0021E483A0|nr:SDR family oxidoreductase [Paucibacter sp. DJ1R-11]MCV2363162.1 SDR family oxidoreductase [Paucibacter sp. DJ1R-11]